MDWRAQCAAVIPCLNEAATIGPLVQEVRRELSTVVVVDDGSNDETDAIAQKAGATVLSNDFPNGKGAALQRGWRHAHKLGFSWALTLDGDGQHSPEDMHSFFECAEHTGAVLVVGNRMPEAAQMPWVRRVVNRWMTHRICTLSGRALPDTQCGFRLLNLDVWAKLLIASQHFEIESEVLMAFIRGGFVVEFVPVRAIYKDEHSKIHPWRDTIRWLRWWRRLREGDSKTEGEDLVGRATEVRTNLPTYLKLPVSARVLRGRGLSETPPRMNSS
jgi:glycosyltransferase involved in cell wall biosynthesis